MPLALDKLMGGTPHKFKIKRSYLSFHDKLQPIDLIQRNADKRSGKYKATLAHQKCTNRRSTKPKKIRFTETIRQQTEDLLKGIVNGQLSIASFLIY